jgi:hypothetical protein
MCGGYVSVHLSLHAHGKAMQRYYQDITGCQPDSGNPTVRDERGACGNVSYGGTRNPPYEPKGYVSETLHLPLCAPYFYPTNFRDGFASF